MNGIFENVMRNNQEWCTDHLLEIINEVLHMASEIMKKHYDQGGEGEGEAKPKKVDSEEGDSAEKRAPQVIFDSFLVNFEYFIILLGASDVVSIYFKIPLYFLITYLFLKYLDNHRKSSPKHPCLHPFLNDPGHRPQ